MVPLLDHDVGDGGLVGAVPEPRARRADGEKLPGHHGLELALAHPVPEHDQPLGPLSRDPLELMQQFLDDVLHILDHLLILLRLLDPDLDLILHMGARVH